MCLKYPKSQHAIVRKTQADVYGSVLQTYETVIEGAPVEPYGGKKPERYIYSNGATVWVGGMDKAGKVLSSERDSVYVCQAEQLTLDEWETITTRTTGRGAVMPYTMTWGDCNPGPKKHWIQERKKAGKLKLIRTTHKDNPTLFDPATGEITEQGRRTLGQLASTTGMRYKRLFKGEWATAEGVVYDTFDENVHVQYRPYSEFKQFYLAMDEGYTNPAVVLLIGIDNDGRWHIFKEFYKRGVLQKKVVTRADNWYRAIRRYVEIKKLGAVFSMAVVDEAAAGLIADLRDSSIPSRGAKGRVLDGIQTVQDHLALAGDSRPGLTVSPLCVETINEFESYVWKQNRDGSDKDEPVKENDHAMDALRYFGSLAGQPSGADLVAFA